MSHIINSFKQILMISSNDLIFLRSNVKGVKGLQSPKKRIKLIEYFKSKLNHHGFFFFLQETHSTIKNENTWINDFNGPGFFFSGSI